MSETQQLCSGHLDDFEELQRERASEVLGTLEDGIAEMSRLNDEAARAARQGQPRSSTSELLAYSHVSDSA